MRDEINNILEKQTLNSTDIDILMKNLEILTQEEKQRLGLVEEEKIIKKRGRPARNLII